MFQNFWECNSAEKSCSLQGCRAVGVWCISVRNKKEMGRRGGGGASLAHDLRDSLPAMSALCTLPIPQLAGHSGPQMCTKTPGHISCHHMRNSVTSPMAVGRVAPASQCQVPSLNTQEAQPRTAPPEDPLFPRSFH